MNTQTAPKMLNGYPVIAALPRACGGFVVIVKREGALHPYVTAIWSQNMGTEWCWGHYTKNPHHAIKNMLERIR